MRLKYGAYLHDVAEAAVSISKEALLSDNGDVIGLKEIGRASCRERV